MFMWIVVILVFSVLVIVHEAGHLFVAKKNGIRVEVFSLGLGKRLCGREIAGTDYRISLIPFGGYCKMAGEDPEEASGADDEFASKSPFKRFSVVVAGALTNYVFAFFIFSAVFMIGSPTLSNRIGQVLEEHPAGEAGLAEGDRIVSISGLEVSGWDDILEVVGSYQSGDGPLAIEVLRGNEELEFEITPRVTRTVNIFRQEVERPMIGIAPASEIEEVSYPLPAAFYQGGRKLLKMTGMTYKGIWLLVTGALPLEGSVAGPIGIAHVMGEAARVGLVPLLLITAHVSLALAVFNLLPFPVLDGGHVIFIAIEKLRGRPVSPRVQETISYVALFILLAFALFISWQDLLKFTPLGD